MLKAGIIGATGYTGSELLRLLVGHPQVEILVVTSRTEQDRAVTDYFPALRGYTKLCFSDPESPLLNECDVVFFATPNGTAMSRVPELLQSGRKVIDLSADFRLDDPDTWSKWYGQPHAAGDFLQEAVYGLPELNREKISSARLVANPGCYPTAVILALIPLLEAGVVDPWSLVADAKSGISGAGRKLVEQNLFAEMNDSFRAYGADGHRHHPEISQVLQQVAGKPVSLTFVPHHVPMIRGIHATVYGTLVDGAPDIRGLYSDRYRNSPFVDILPEGSHPDTRSVRGSNYCRIAMHRQEGSDRVIILSVIDNLVKGAAGQAVQNMNLMFDLPETTGLEAAPLSP